ncbi:hypothetical protein ACFLY2_00760 [Patescibacteria group bacterium]
MITFASSIVSIQEALSNTAIASSKVIVLLGQNGISHVKTVPSSQVSHE